MMKTVADLVNAFGMQRHEEGGWYCPVPGVEAAVGRAISQAGTAMDRANSHEGTADSQGEGRAASGAIYYALMPGEAADFHVIDCDEYWCHHAGDVLQLWMIDTQGRLSVRLLGADGEGEPLIWIPAGTAFAARHLPGNDQGTLVSCITVPKFDYSGWRLLSKKEVCELCPAASAFWE